MELREEADLLRILKSNSIITRQISQCSIIRMKIQPCYRSRPTNNNRAIIIMGNNKIKMRLSKKLKLQYNCLK